MKRAKSKKVSNPQKQNAPQVQTALVGRANEALAIRACIRAQKNILIEGPVGVGKTHLALHLAQELKRPVFRVDGDNRYTEQKLSGWFDPPTVIKKGFGKEAFIPGPLIEAMQAGGILFINELNRLPEGVQNVLLPAIDEKLVVVPKLGTVRAKAGFIVIATQNPKEFVATSHLSEAILDRFELVLLDYQSEADEVQIVLAHIESGSEVTSERLARASVRLSRLTRNHPRIRRGASVRAALSIADIAVVLMADGKNLAEAFAAAVRLALPTRIEMERDAESADSSSGKTTSELQDLISEWIDEVLASLDQKGDFSELKKKP